MSMEGYAHEGLGCYAGQGPDEHKKKVLMELVPKVFPLGEEGTTHLGEEGTT